MYIKPLWASWIENQQTWSSTKSNLCKQVSYGWSLQANHNTILFNPFSCPISSTAHIPLYNFMASCFLYNNLGLWGHLGCLTLKLNTPSSSCVLGKIYEFFMNVAYGTSPFWHSLGQFLEISNRVFHRLLFNVMFELRDQVGFVWGSWNQEFYVVFLMLICSISVVWGSKIFKLQLNVMFWVQIQGTVNALAPNHFSFFWLDHFPHPATIMCCTFTTYSEFFFLSIVQPHARLRFMSKEKVASSLCWSNSGNDSVEMFFCKLKLLELIEASNRISDF